MTQNKKNLFFASLLGLSSLPGTLLGGATGPDAPDASRQAETTLGIAVATMAANAVYQQAQPTIQNAFNYLRELGAQLQAIATTVTESQTTTEEAQQARWENTARLMAQDINVILPDESQIILADGIGRTEAVDLYFNFREIVQGVNPNFTPEPVMESMTQEELYAQYQRLRQAFIQHQIASINMPGLNLIGTTTFIQILNRVNQFAQRQGITTTGTLTQRLGQIAEFYKKKSEVEQAAAEAIAKKLAKKRAKTNQLLGDSKDEAEEEQVPSDLAEMAQGVEMPVANAAPVVQETPQASAPQVAQRAVTTQTEVLIHLSLREQINTLQNELQEINLALEQIKNTPNSRAQRLALLQSQLEKTKALNNLYAERRDAGRLDTKGLEKAIQRLESSEKSKARKQANQQIVNKK
jgi:hypothetical protein